VEEVRDAVISAVVTVLALILSLKGISVMWEYQHGCPIPIVSSFFFVLKCECHNYDDFEILRGSNKF
jgi:hypothetical protein